MKNNRIITQLSHGGTMRCMKRIATATLALAAFALFAGGIADTFRPTHAEEVQIGAIVGSGFVQITDGACSAANTANQPAYDAVNNVLDINVMPGALASNCFGVTVTTDNTLGYSMTISGPSTGNLTLAGQSIKQKDGSLENPTVFADQTNGGVWGFAIPNNQIQNGNWGFEDSYSVLPRNNTTNTAKYAPVPTSPTTLDTVSTISGTQSFDYDVFFATSAGAYAPTGTYTGTVTISAFGNAAVPPTIMQELTDTTLAEVCTDTRTMVMDARDSATYWIRKIPNTKGGGGDLCWMETNLAYAGGGDNAYGDTITISQGMSPDNATAYYDVPSGSNRTEGTAEPSTGTNGTEQYGYLYNWCAAMADQPDACQGSTATQPTESVSICPAGWRLPAGGSSGEFASLNNAINSGSTSSSSGLLSNGLYMYSGSWSNYVFRNQGSSGYYWSSMVYDGSSAYIFSLDSAHVSPTNSIDKRDAAAVRCVKEIPEAATRADIQTVTAANCPTTRTETVDARDGATYLVQKMADGECWMLTNLAYAGGGLNTYGDVTPAITKGSTSADSTYTDERYFDPADSDYGYLYNWCAAMNGQSAACQGSSASQPNQSVNGGTSSTLYNICPSGWRLPRSSEFGTLHGSLGTSDSTALMVEWLGQLGGYWNNGSFTSQGSSGFYWSSMVYPSFAADAYHLLFGASGGTGSVETTAHGSKRAGMAVRCIAP